VTGFTRAIAAGAEPAQADPDALTHKGFRSYGHSKDHRGDLPQIVVGMAVTRDGIPVRVWSWLNAVAFMAADNESRGHCFDRAWSRASCWSWSDRELCAV